ncbi:hypothetical protein K502DRAFT_324181 [Neoconidiobolus thromboides FSU 785]|nr:hypothetical protein K502DRAFT_324181 [Neoconidiobolus thromboides FSU 785]
MAPTTPYASSDIGNKPFDLLFEDSLLKSPSNGSETSGKGYNIGRSASSNPSLNVPDFGNNSDKKEMFTPIEEQAFDFLFEKMGGKQLGFLDGNQAVPYFKKSNLDPSTLSKIWQMADLKNEGLLRFPGFKVAMKLIAMAQNGRTLALSHLSGACPLPTFDGIIIPTSRSSSRSTRGSFSRSPFDQVSNSPFDSLASNSRKFSKIPFSDAQKYYRIFQKASFGEDVLDGNSVRDIMMKSNIPVEILKDIWNVSDTEGKGQLEAFEFIIAMYYMENVMNDTIAEIPLRLPLDIKESALSAVKVLTQPSPPVSVNNFRNMPSYSSINSYSTSLTSPFNNQFSTAQTNPYATTTNAPFSSSIYNEKNDMTWDISKQDLNKYYSFFDNVVSNPLSRMSSQEAYQIFIRSKLSNSDLAEIWELADIKSRGSLSRDEFAVAMHLIYDRLNGNDIPLKLPKSLIPPGMRDSNSFSKATTSLPGSHEFDLLINEPQKKQDPFLESKSMPSFSDINESDLLSFDTSNAPSLSSYNTAIPFESSFNMNKVNMDKLKAEIDPIKNEIEDAIESINSHRPRKAKLESQSEFLEEQKRQLTLKINEIDTSTQLTQAQMLDLQNKIQDLEPKLINEKEELAQIQNQCLNKQKEIEEESLKIQESLAKSKMAKEYLHYLQGLILETQKKVEENNKIAETTKVQNEANDEIDPFTALVENESKKVENNTRDINDPFMSLVEDTKAKEITEHPVALEEEDPFMSLVEENKGQEVQVKKVESLNVEENDPFLALVDNNKNTVKPEEEANDSTKVKKDIGETSFTEDDPFADNNIVDINQSLEPTFSFDDLVSSRDIAKSEIKKDTVKMVLKENSKDDQITSPKPESLLGNHTQNNPLPPLSPPPSASKTQTSFSPFEVVSATSPPLSPISITELPNSNMSPSQKSINELIAVPETSNYKSHINFDLENINDEKTLLAFFNKHMNDLHVISIDNEDVEEKRIQKASLNYNFPQGLFDQLESPIFDEVIPTKENLTFITEKFDFEAQTPDPNNDTSFLSTQLDDSDPFAMIAERETSVISNFPLPQEYSPKSNPFGDSFEDSFSSAHMPSTSSHLNNPISRTESTNVYYDAHENMSHLKNDIITTSLPISEKGDETHNDQSQNMEKQNSEVKKDEVKGNEAQNTQVKDKETQNTEVGDSEIQDTEVRDSETQPGFGTPNGIIESLKVDDSKVTELMQMGFTIEQANEALAKYDNDLDLATNFLLDS